MGQILNKEQVLLDWNINRIGYKNGIYEEEDRSKNWEYWSGNRPITKISRELYSRDYVKGYFYGRYEIKNEIDDIE